MKVLHVIDKLDVGGAENVVVSLINIFSEKGANVAVLSLLDKGELSNNINIDVKQYFLNRKNKFSVITYLKFYDIIKSYDVLHVHMRHNLKYVVLCKLFCPGRFPKIVFHDHTGVVSDNMLLMNVFTFVNAYIGVSRKNVEWAKKRMKIDKVFLLPNIIRKENYLPVIRDKDIVMVGNIRPEKNYEFVFKLSERLNKKIDIYGNYVNEKYKKEIERVKPHNVNIITGEKRIQKVINRYKMALHCAPLETGPLVLIEYLAQGVPFITYNTGEVTNQIRDFLPEFIVYSFDETEWIEAIENMQKLISNDLTRLQRKIKKVYERLYSEDKYFEKCMKIYKSL